MPRNYNKVDPVVNHIKDTPYALLHLSGNRYGGWPTFLAHLALGFKDAGIPVRVYKVGNKTEDKKRDYGLGISYRNVDLKKAKKIIKKWPTLLTAIELKGNYAEWAPELIKAGAMPMIHDPNELKPDMRDLLQPGVLKRPCFAPRLRSVDYMMDELGIETFWLRHPYKRWPNPHKVERSHHAVSISRIDFEKHIEVMAQANKILPKDKRIYHYGFIFRPYAQHTLDPKFKWWRKYYVDKWDWRGADGLYGGASIAKSARYVVDMSWIKNDGGGTQYSFLEAWDAGARLILHENWLCDKSSFNEIEDAACFVDGPEQLVSVLTNKKGRKRWEERQVHVNRILESHDAGKVAKELAVCMRRYWM